LAKPHRGICDDCQRKRDLFRPVRQNVDGTVAWVCRQCWRDKDYDLYMQRTDEFPAQRELA